MATPVQRKLMAQISELGFQEDGTASGNAVVMRHPEAGRLVIHATPSDHRYEMNKLAEARRKVRQTHDKVGEFVTWLMQEHDVPRDGRKELYFNVRREAQRYLESHPNGGKLNTLSGQIGKDDRVQILERRQGIPETHLVITGPDFLPEPAQEPQEALPAPPEYAPMAISPEAASAPLDIILEQIQRLASQQNGTVDELQARVDLAYTTLDQAMGLIGQAMEILKEDRQRRAGGSQTQHPAQAH